MAGMTYRQLKAHLEVMDDEQLDSDVTIRLMPEDEYYGYTDIGFSPANDVLDKNHPFINVDMTGGDKELPEKQNSVSIE